MRTEIFVSREFALLEFVQHGLAHVETGPVFALFATQLRCCSSAVTYRRCFLIWFPKPRLRERSFLFALFATASLFIFSTFGKLMLGKRRVALLPIFLESYVGNSARAGRLGRREQRQLKQRTS